MPGYELHADFDRSGRIGGMHERAARLRAPGAIVAPNLDVDRRPLPGSVRAGQRQVLDAERRTRTGSDDELLPILVRTTRAHHPGGAQLLLQFDAHPKLLIDVHDRRGRSLPTLPRSSIYDMIEVPITPAPPGRDLRLNVEVATAPGSPETSPSSLAVYHLPDHMDGTRMRVRLLSRAPDGSEVEHDRGIFTVSPAIVVGNASPVTHLFICELGDNEPTLRELRAGLREVRGVRLVRVPGTLTGGDTWLQDQYQHALVRDTRGWQQLIIHLPRMTSQNMGATEQSNLSTVVESHFPSRDIGLFDGLRRRRIEFQDANGTMQSFSFQDSFQLQHEMGAALELHEEIVDGLRAYDRAFSAGRFQGWSATTLGLGRLLVRLRRAMRRAEELPRAERLGIERRLRGRLRLVRRAVPYDRRTERFELPVGTSRHPVTQDRADELWSRLWQLHSSSNYGGNIEASPPVRGAPLGKLVIGRYARERPEDFDPDLYDFFVKQNKQPLVEINTAWLHVGHVDELLAFAPDRAGDAGFAILRSSSRLGSRIVELALERYRAGLSPTHVHRRDEPSVVRRLTVDGTSPVTRMFRGKVWRHIERPERNLEPRQPRLLPPRIYRRIVEGRNHFGELRYVNEVSPDDRVYPADTTVHELIFAERDQRGVSTNRFVEERFLEPLRERLQEEFPGARVFPLPTLFDRVRSTRAWAQSPYGASTGAFAPLLVNMQVIGVHLFVPRPFGPRMRVDDARAVLAAAAQEMRMPRRFVGRLTPTLIRRRRLDRGVYWIQPQSLELMQNGLYLGVGRDLLDADDIRELFADSFPGVTDENELERLVIRPNRARFDRSRRLRRGWQPFVVRDGMLDLFETWMELVASALRIRLHWVDAWHYHLRLGGLHCGTNVLRSVTPPGLPAPWRVPDVRRFGGA